MIAEYEKKQLEFKATSRRSLAAQAAHAKKRKQRAGETLCPAEEKAATERAHENVVDDIEMLMKTAVMREKTAAGPRARVIATAELAWLTRALEAVK